MFRKRAAVTGVVGSMLSEYKLRNMAAGKRAVCYRTTNQNYGLHAMEFGVLIPSAGNAVRLASGCKKDSRR